MRGYIFLISFILFRLTVSAQIERGKIINAPKINSNKKNNNSKTETKPKVKEELDFIFEDEPKLKFSNQYDNTKESTTTTNNGQPGIKIEPLRDVNTIVNEDTSSIDEGELLVVEIEENAQFRDSDQMVGIASYYSVWDTHTLNPYGINPKDLNEMISIKLYDPAEGRNWAPVLDKTVLTSHFGWRWRRWHKGTDLDVVTGDPVYAPFDGVIRVAGVHSGYGRTLILRHYNGLETLYGHLSAINFDPNTEVKAGEEIAKGGNSGRSSGSHLHFETRYEGNQFDPENIYNFKVNPMEIKNQEFVISSKLYDYLRGGSSRPANVAASENTPANIENAANNTSDVEEEEEEEEEEIPTQIIKKVWYQVHHGDSLIEIARKFKTTVPELCRLNKIPANKKIFTGLKIRVN